MSAAYGTEIVAYGLATGLAASGIEVHVAYHGQVNSTEPVFFEGLQVHELAPLPVADRHMHFNMRTPEVPGLAALLARLKPDIVQTPGLHAASINRRHVELAKAHGCKVIMWHNVPGVTCLQTGLLYEGKEPCDGAVDVQRCTYCRLRVRGLPSLVAQALSRVGLPVVDGTPHRLDSLLSARGLTERHADAVARTLGEPDAIRVGALWARDVLKRNGVPEAKLHLIRPGVNLREASDSTAIPNPWSKAGSRAGSKAGAGRPVRMIYWGRVHRSKGIHTVLEALALRPSLQVEFAIFGDVDLNVPYCRDLKEQARADGRVEFHGRIAPDQVLALLRTADLAIIPSRWHETGPLTVFEAQAAGLPIVGANRGGISELCTGPGSRLFTPEDPHSLAAIFDEVIGRPGVLESMRAQVDKPRTMSDVRADVARLYATLLDGKVN